MGRPSVLYHASSLALPVWEWEAPEFERRDHDPAAHN